MKEITSRYAEALFSIKRDQNQLEETQLEIKELIKVLKQNPDTQNIRALHGLFYFFFCFPPLTASLKA